MVDSVKQYAEALARIAQAEIRQHQGFGAEPEGGAESQPVVVGGRGARDVWPNRHVVVAGRWSAERRQVARIGRDNRVAGAGAHRGTSSRPAFVVGTAAAA